MSGPEVDMAALKAELAALGVDLHSSAHRVAYTPPAYGQPLNIVVIDRIADVKGPPTYCVHGFVHCISCGELCYLGSETSRLVTGDKGIHPLCLACARKHVPRRKFTEPVNHVIDHPRP